MYTLIQQSLVIEQSVDKHDTISYVGWLVGWLASHLTNQTATQLVTSQYPKAAAGTRKASLE